MASRERGEILAEAIAVARSRVGRVQDGDLVLQGLTIRRAAHGWVTWPSVSVHVHDGQTHGPGLCEAMDLARDRLAETRTDLVVAIACTPHDSTARHLLGELQDLKLPHVRLQATLGGFYDAFSHGPRFPSTLITQVTSPGHTPWMGHPQPTIAWAVNKPDFPPPVIAAARTRLHRTLARLKARTVPDLGQAAIETLRRARIADHAWTGKPANIATVLAALTIPRLRDALLLDAVPGHQDLAKRLAAGRASSPEAQAAFTSILRDQARSRHTHGLPGLLDYMTQVHSAAPEGLQATTQAACGFLSMQHGWALTARAWLDQALATEPRLEPKERS